MSEANSRWIDRIEGTAIPLRGDNIDTDRIMPARFLRSSTFEGLEDHIFEDDRRQLEGQPTPHSFSNPAFRGASLLLVNRNFGCGSSREHAPQALMRWGIRAIVGESFSAIFFGNSAALGIPCLAASRDEVEFLMRLVEANPGSRVSVSVAGLTIEAGGRRMPGSMSRATQEAFLSGAWDATALLLDRFDEVRAVASRLPYIAGF